jgi:type VI secretion system protein VasJ
LNGDTLTKEQISHLSVAAGQLADQLKHRKFDSPLKALPDKLAALTPPDNATQAATPTATNKPVTRATDPGDERRQRTRLMELAERINEEMPDDPLGYLLRRYVLWSGIQAVPTTDSNGETELMPPPADIISTYQEQVNGVHSNLELLFRIEKSVASSPFWISGSLLSVQVAGKLGYERVADGISHAIESLLARLPRLSDTRFKGGQLFFEGRLRDTGRKGLDTLAATNSDGTQSLASEIETLYREQGIGAALDAIESRRQHVGSSRESYYLTLMAGETLANAGLGGILEGMIEATAERVGSMSVAEWEPEYLNRLENLRSR